MKGDPRSHSGNILTVTIWQDDDTHLRDPLGVRCAFLCIWWDSGWKYPRGRRFGLSPIHSVHHRTDKTLILSLSPTIFIFCHEMIWLEIWNVSVADPPDTPRPYILTLTKNNWKKN